MLHTSPGVLKLPAELVAVIRARSLSTSATLRVQAKHTFITTPIFYVNAGTHIRSDPVTESSRPEGQTRTLATCTRPSSPTSTPASHAFGTRPHHRRSCAPAQTSMVSRSSVWQRRRASLRERCATRSASDSGSVAFIRNGGMAADFAWHLGYRSSQRTLISITASSFGRRRSATGSRWSTSGWARTLAPVMLELMRERAARTGISRPHLQVFILGLVRCLG